MNEFVVITGLSGAGRSTAADVFEDLGWFVIDNVPPALIPKLGELAAPGSGYDRIALVVRTGRFEEELAAALESLPTSARRVRMLFLDAADDVLVRRYEDTRRSHPLGVESTVAEAIVRERAVLDPLKARADVVVDTTELNVHQLKARILELFSDEAERHQLRVSVVSFGYKHGLPLDVDLVFDVRFLPNPHWVDSLRPLTGRDAAVRDYVLGQPETDEFLGHLEGLLGMLLPAYVREGKSYLGIAIGCTGGRHRSVVLAERVADLVRRHGFDPAVSHRDVDR